MKLLQAAAVFLLQFILRVWSADVEPKSIAVYNAEYNKTCAQVKNDAEKQLNVKTEYRAGKNASATIYLSFEQENINLTNAEVMITHSEKRLFTIDVTGLYNNNYSVSNIFYIESNDTQGPWKNPKGKKAVIKEILMGNNSLTKTSTKDMCCFNVGFVYEAEKGTNNVTTFNMGCWSWDNSTQKLVHSVKTANLANWADEIGKGLCGGALALQLSPLIALVVALLVSYANQ